MISILEDPRGSHFFKISRNSWTSSHSAIDDDTGTFRQYLNDPINGLIFPFEDKCGNEFLYEDGLCHRDSVEVCICYTCCRNTYFSRVGFYHDLDLYFWRADNTTEIPEAPCPDFCENAMKFAGGYLEEARKKYLGLL